jgi:hypothetical protein
MPLGASLRKPLPQSPCRKIEPDSSASRSIGATIRTLNKDWINADATYSPPLCCNSLCFKRGCATASRRRCASYSG